MPVEEKKKFYCHCLECHHRWFTDEDLWNLKLTLTCPSCEGMTCDWSTTENVQRNVNRQVVFAVDPGTTQSGWAVLDASTCHVFTSGKSDNRWVLGRCQHFRESGSVVVIEKFTGRGQVVGNETLDACWWSGRFYESAGSAHMITRPKVRGHFKAMNDREVREALIKKFGGKDVCIRTKKNPGMLYGVTADAWQAIAIAVAWWETEFGPLGESER